MPNRIEKLIKLAEFDGYTFKDEGWRYPDNEDWQKYKAVYHGNGFIGLCKPDWTQVPDYFGDLNAIHKLEKKLLKSMGELGFLTNTDEMQSYPAYPWYLNKLNKVCGGSSVFSASNCEVEAWKVVSATAEQRAEAIYQLLEENAKR